MKAKIIVIGIAVLVFAAVGAWELRERRAFDTMVAERDADLEKNKPFYDCIIAASAMVRENSSAEVVIAAGVAERECYERFNK